MAKHINIPHSGFLLYHAPYYSALFRNNRSNVPHAILTSFDALNNEPDIKKILKKFIAQMMQAFVKVSKSGFEYYTQTDLVVKRNGYGQYLEQSSDANNLILTFNRVAKDGDNHFQLSHRQSTLFSFKGSIYKNLYLVWKHTFKRVLDNTYPAFLSGIKFVFELLISSLIFSWLLKSKTQMNRDTIKGEYYRNLSNSAALFIFSFVFVGLGILFSAVANPPIANSTNCTDSNSDSASSNSTWTHTNSDDGTSCRIKLSIASALTTIGMLLLGLYLSNAWKILRVDLPVDEVERERYRDEIGSGIYWLNLIDKIEKIENEIINDIQHLLPPANNEEEIRQQIKEKVKEKLRSPIMKGEIEQAIIKRINSLPGKKIILNDLLESAGDDLYKTRLRRSFVKRELGPAVKKAIEEETIFRVARNIGFFSENDDPRFEGELDRPQNPLQCYIFVNIKQIIK